MKRTVDLRRVPRGASSNRSVSPPVNPPVDPVKGAVSDWVTLIKREERIRKRIRKAIQLAPPKKPPKPYKAKRACPCCGRRMLRRESYFQPGHIGYIRGLFRQRKLGRLWGVTFDPDLEALYHKWAKDRKRRSVREVWEEMVRPRPVNLRPEK